MSNPYERLAPFIQDYVYQQGWTDLRQVQVEACRVIFETDAHLLIAAGTASGKTEAAFLPVLTLLHEDPPTTIGAMYIGPLKALINDQFDRLNDLLKAANIPVWAWHGDITQTQKNKLLKQPQGILQITPESLESLLINKSAELDRLFGDLRFVIIDEIHAFVGSDRGDQILCQLARLSQLTQQNPRRIGLSATLGDYALAERWLSAGTGRLVTTPQIPAGQRQVRLSLEHFYTSEVVRAQGDVGDAAFKPYDLYLFQQSQVHKCLIFANGRTEAEGAIAALRQLATAKGLPDIYHVHHGSIAAPMREGIESAMRDRTTPTVTAATVTFEMGIDLGQLDRVIQLEAPPSVASFLQRLGRSGRRGSPADMRFICAEAKPQGDEWLPEQIPWQLLQSIAIIQLYLEEKWIEPSQPAQYPFSLLYHQTLSTLAALGELSPAALAQKVLTLPPFQAISQADFRQLLHHLINLDHIQKTSEGGLILGLAGERIARNFKFYAIFPDQEEYTVRDGVIALGKIVVPPSPGSYLNLAGRTWQVVSVDLQRKTVDVQPGQGRAETSWRGGSGKIHTRILQRMRQVLFEDMQYPYLQAGAKARLTAARHLARSYELDRCNLHLLDQNLCCLLPWMGTDAFHTLERVLNHHCKEVLKIKRVMGRSPYFLMIDLGRCSLESLCNELQSFSERPITAEMLLQPEEVPQRQKYDAFIPPDLLCKAFLADGLSLEEFRILVHSWRKIH